MRRTRHQMPTFIRDALLRGKLMAADRRRSPYQQNDTIGWIGRAKRDETRRRRLDQMLDELEAGDRYMKIAYRPQRGPR